MTELKIKIKDHLVNPNEKVIELTKDSLLIATINPKIDQITIMSPIFFNISIDDSLFPEKIYISLSEKERQNEISLYVLIGLENENDYYGDVLGFFPTLHEVNFNLEEYKKQSNHIIKCENSECKKIPSDIDYDTKICSKCNDNKKDIIEYDKFEEFKIEKWNYNWSNRKYEFNKILNKLNHKW